MRAERVRTKRFQTIPNGICQLVVDWQWWSTSGGGRLVVRSEFAVQNAVQNRLVRTGAYQLVALPFVQVDLEQFASCREREMPD